MKIITSNSNALVIARRVSKRYMPKEYAAFASHNGTLVRLGIDTYPTATLAEQGGRAFLDAQQAIRDAALAPTEEAGFITVPD